MKRLGVCFALATPLFGFGGCGEGVKGPESLDTPSVAWEQRVSNCSRYRALDAHRVLWHDQGCEGDGITLKRLGTVTVERYARIEAAVDAALSTVQGTGVCQGSSRHIFSFRSVAGDMRTIEKCTNALSFGGLDGLSDPLLTIAEALNQE